MLKEWLVTSLELLVEAISFHLAECLFDCDVKLTKLESCDHFALLFPDLIVELESLDRLRLQLARIVIIDLNDDIALGFLLDYVVCKNAQSSLLQPHRVVPEAVSDDLSVHLAAF